MPLKPGGPCIFCGATESSTWYGKKATKDSPAQPVCRSNPCKEQAGYKVRKKRSREHGSVLDDEVAEDWHNSIQWVSDVEAVLGVRCAPTAQHARASAHALHASFAALLLLRTSSAHVWSSAHATGLRTSRR